MECVWGGGGIYQRLIGISVELVMVALDRWENVA